MKHLAILLALVLVLTLAGCARVPGSKTPTTAAPTAPAATDEPTVPGPGPEPSAEPTESAPTDPTPTDPPEPPAPEREIREVDARYFSDALFIGDSRTDGLRLFSPIKGATYYCGTSMTIFGILDSQETVDGVTGLRNLLKSRQYGKIYLMLGINEAGYDDDAFADKYRSVVEELRAAQPGALIYLQSILYVTQNHEQKYPVFATEKLKRKNEKIRGLANDEDVFYLEVNDCMNDGTDHLPSDYTGDGVHLKASYYSLWRDYLMANAVVDADHPWISRELSPEGAALRKTLDEKLEGLRSEWQVVAVDPATGEMITAFRSPSENGVTGTDELMKSASFVRLFILADVYQQIKDGRLREEEVLDDLTAMITKNDTAAADRLAALLGGGDAAQGREQVKTYARSLGYQIGFNRGLSEDALKYNYVSAETVADLLSRLLRGACVSPEYDKKMTDLLFAVTAYDFDLGLPAEEAKGFLFDAPTADVLGAAGIVSAGGRTFAVCILANDVTEQTSSRQKLTELLSAIHTSCVGS